MIDQLFGGDLPGGFRYQVACITPAEEPQLVAATVRPEGRTRSEIFGGTTARAEVGLTMVLGGTGL